MRSGPRFYTTLDVGHVTVNDFGIDADRPLLAARHRMAIDSGCRAAIDEFDATCAREGTGMVAPRLREIQSPIREQDFARQIIGSD